jgi:hypothetical protein
VLNGDAESLSFEEFLEEGAQLGVVVDDQDSHAIRILRRGGDSR